MDEPEEVHRLIGEIEVAWYEAYNDFAKVLELQGAYTDWNGLLSRKPSYITPYSHIYTTVENRDKLMKIVEGR